jgi:hypothetical protein
LRLTYTFDNFGWGRPAAAPPAREIADQATVCADRGLDIVKLVKQYRATHGADAQPTPVQLAAAGLLRQPAAWQLTYSGGGFGGGYQNAWCPA